MMMRMQRAWWFTTPPSSTTLRSAWACCAAATAAVVRPPLTGAMRGYSSASSSPPPVSSLRTTTTTSQEQQTTMRRRRKRPVDGSALVAEHHRQQHRQAASALLRYRQRTAKTARRKFLQRAYVEAQVAFPIPPVMDSAAFVAFLKTRTRRLMELLVEFHKGPPTPPGVASHALPSTVTTGMRPAASATEGERQRRHRRTMQFKMWEARLAPLLSVREKDVEAHVWEGKERLKSELMASCLVPYRLAVNFILARLPPELRALSIQQLQAAERAAKNKDNGDKAVASDRGDDDGPRLGFTILQWVEEDVYGNRATMRLGEPRIPVFALIGHSRCGKTALMSNMLDGRHDGGGDAAQQQQQGQATGSLFAELEGIGDRRGRTEALRAVTVSLSSIGRPSQDAALVRALSGGSGEEATQRLSAGSIDDAKQPSSSATPPAMEPHRRGLYPEQVSLIDTPGHRIFSEMRLHTVVASDTVLLVVGLDEGVLAQTREAVVVALNVDRPVVVIFNKLDVFTDEGSGAKALKAAVADLESVGLDVSLCASEGDLEAILVGHSTPAAPSQSDAAPRASSSSGKMRANPSSTAANNRSGNSKRQQHDAWRYFACRQGDVDPSYAGSIRKPVLQLRRRALGVCVSATRRWNLDLVAAVMRWTVSLQPPRAVSGPSLGKTEPCGVQAVVLEASKQAYDVEASAVSPARRAMETKHLVHKERREARYKRRGGSVKAQAMQAQRYYAYGRGAHSSGQGNQNLVLTVVVRSGVLTVGTAFVADQCVGVVEKMVDYFGRPVRAGLPGMVVTVLDTHCRTGCPGAGIHLLSLPTYLQACRVFEYRRILQWYVEVFSKKTHLLRPRGMPSNFAHLGIYAQEDASLLHSLGMQLLYGPPPPAAAADGVGSKPALADGRNDAGQLSPGSTTARESRALEAQTLEHHDDNSIVSQREEGEEHHPMPTTQAQVDVLQGGGIGKFLQDQAAQALNEEEIELLSTTTSLVADGQSGGDDGGGTAALLHARWLALQPPPASVGSITTEKEWMALQAQKTQIGVMIKVDSWHTARILYREVHKLGTSRIALHVLVARFGRMTVDDYMVASGAVKVVLCYRTPKADSVLLEKHLEIHNVRFAECDAMEDALLFLKRCAVELHMELFGRDGGGDDAEAEEVSRRRQGGEGSVLRVALRTERQEQQQQQSRQQLQLGNNHTKADGSSGGGTGDAARGADAYLGALLHAAVGIGPQRDATLRRRQRLTTRRRD